MVPFFRREADLAGKVEEIGHVLKMCIDVSVEERMDIFAQGGLLPLPYHRRKVRQASLTGHWLTAP